MGATYIMGVCELTHAISPISLSLMLLRPCFRLRRARTGKAEVEGSDPPLFPARCGRGGVAPFQNIPADCFYNFRKPFTIKELCIFRIRSSPHSFHRDESDVFGPSWPCTDVTVRSSRARAVSHPSRITTRPRPED